MANPTKINHYLDQEKDLVSHLTDHLPIGIYRTTIDGKIKYANKALSKMLGYSFEELENIRVSDLFLNPLERNAEIEILASSDKISASQVIQLKTKSGNIIIVKDTIKIIRDKTNEIICFDGILEDITDKKRAEDALKESQTRYKTLANITLEGIIIHKNGIIIDVNPSAQKMTGFDMDSLIGKKILDFIHPDSKEVAQQNIMNKYVGVQELKLVRADKSSFIAEAEGNNVLIDEKEYRVVAFRDITKRKEIEKEILSLSTAVKQSPTSIVITNTDGIIEYVNPKFTEVTGYTHQEVIGKNPSILKTEHTAPQEYKDMWDTISNGETWNGEFLNKKKDGSHYWELASISPIIDETRSIIKYLAVKEDITERKNTEVALLDSEKKLSQANATKNMFFSIIAHDLKGPVGNFSEILNLCRANLDNISSDELEEYLNMLSILSTKTNNLLDDLLLWARIQMNTIEINFQKVNVANLMQESAEMVKEKADKKNIEIVINTENTWIETNKSSLKTVIRNFLTNAIKFSYDDSIVELSAITSKEKNKIVFSIADHGVGIPKEDVNKLFKIETSFSTYGTNKEKGTGLGLILCKELANKINGSVWVESKENKGSTFYLAVPLQG